MDIAERRLTRDGAVVALPPKVFDLLVVFLQNPGRLLEKNELLQLVWPDAFVEESNLSVHISALRKALGDQQTNSRWIETVPKRGYRFIGELQTVQTESPPVARKPNLAWAGVLLVVILAGIGWVYFEDRGKMPGSLAVLPFLPLTNTDDHKYLGLGVGDAVTTRLTALGQLDVRPTSLVSRYDAPDRDVIAAGKALGVEAVLDGRIQVQGDRIRATAQLLRVKDGRQLWADTFDEKFANIFSLEDLLADRAARALALKVAVDSDVARKRTTTNAEAYQLYLQGQYLVSKRVHAATQNAITAFEQSIARDPNYPLPHAALAQSLLIRAGEGWGEGLRDRARSSALRAISLDDQLAESQLALGQVLMRADWDWVGAEKAFRRAIKLNPNLASAHAALSNLLVATGKKEEAITEIRAACSLDPSAATWQADLAWVLAFARKYDEAIVEGLKAVALDAWSYSAHRQLSKAHLLKGDHKQSIAGIRQALEINGSRRRRVLTEVATAYARAGQFNESKAALAEVLKDGWQEPLPHYEMAVLENALGHQEQALTHLEKAAQARITRVIWLPEDPELESLQRLPRFQAIVAQLKLPN